MSSITKTKTGVQPLDAADDVILADSSSDEELSGVSEGDGPLRHAEEAKNSMTFSGDGPENLRGPSTVWPTVSGYPVLDFCTCIPRGERSALSTQGVQSPILNRNRIEK